MFNVLDLCSGIGGFTLGLEQTGLFKTVAFCENDNFCKKVLNKHWKDVKIYNDLLEIGNDPSKIKEPFDVVVSGLPCQPYSLAGKQKGKKDDRHLWDYMFKIIKYKKPSWVVLENIPNFVSMALDDVCLDLENENYATQSFIIPACSVGAPHKRDRLWVIAKIMGDSSSYGRDEVDADKKKNRIVSKGKTRGMFQSPRTGTLKRNFKLDSWISESSVCRISNGVPSQLDKDRLKALGNAIVPQIAFNIGLTINTLYRKNL
jgi:DNA (cytosine-5)-methyltransferase 1|tara:strand:- start:210 stop:989 length:780 start_codon:yes stop_codon:yes gene_type:complete